jgi:hypothetical protein
MALISILQAGPGVCGSLRNDIPLNVDPATLELTRLALKTSQRELAPVVRCLRVSYPASPVYADFILRCSGQAPIMAVLFLLPYGFDHCDSW